MFGRLKAWIQEQRRWHRDHVETWRGWSEDSPDSLSRLQVECEAAVAAALEPLGVRFEDREVVHTEKWLYLHSKLSPTRLEFWLHPDTANVSGPGTMWILEEWDTRTPAEFVSRAVAGVTDLVRKELSSVA